MAIGAPPEDVQQIKAGGGFPEKNYKAQLSNANLHQTKCFFSSFSFLTFPLNEYFSSVQTNQEYILIWRRVLELEQEICKTQVGTCWYFLYKLTKYDFSFGELVLLGSAAAAITAH